MRDFNDPAGYERWVQAHPLDVTTLPTVETGRGFHVHAQATEPVVGSKSVGDGELRGAGVLVVVPPSVHETGVLYQRRIPFTSGLPVIDADAVGLDIQHRIPRNTQEDTEHALNLFCVVSGDTRMAIRRTIPPAPGHRWYRIFDLVRELKAIDGLEKQEAHELLPLVQEWHRLALPYIGTKDWDETWGDFAYAWTHVRYAKGDGPLRVSLAKAEIMAPPACAAPYRSKGMHTLLTVCRELQRQVGDKPFFMSVRTAAEILGRPDDIARASRELQKLCGIGILKLEPTHDRVERMANEYRYMKELDQ